MASATRTVDWAAAAAEAAKLEATLAPPKPALATTPTSDQIATLKNEGTVMWFDTTTSKFEVGTLDAYIKFIHSKATPPTVSAPVSPPVKDCSYGGKCYVSTCRFNHPPGHSFSEALKEREAGRHPPPRDVPRRDHSPRRDAPRRDAHRDHSPRRSAPRDHRDHSPRRHAPRDHRDRH